MGIFHQNMSPEAGLGMFRLLASDAFSLRLRLKAPIVKSMVQPFCTFLYKSRGIEGALQRQFGENSYLFGADEASRTSSDEVKVGVVSCLEGRNVPALIANYSRNPIKSKDEDADYLVRKESQRDDFKIWEA